MKIIALDISTSIMVWMFSLFVISSVGFIFHIPINPFYTIISTILSGVILFHRLKKHGIKNSKIFLIFLSLVALVFIFGLIQYRSPDFSFDGCCYHQAAIISLKNGWNPIYTNLLDFSKLQKYQFNATLGWVQSYVKCYEILAANLYSISNKIEFVKVLKFIFNLTSFLYILPVLQGFRNISKKQSYLVAFLLIYNPVSIYQFFTNYNDDVIYNCFLILIFSLIAFCRDDNNKKSLLVTIMITVILASIKFNALYFAGITYLVWLIFYHSKKILKAGVISLILVIICSIHPYFTNMKEGKSPFYPIIKTGKANPLKAYTIDCPVGFENKSTSEKLLISLFSSSSQNTALEQTKIKPTLKIPFTLKHEDRFICAGMRTSGFGYFFSGILLLSLIVGILLRFKNKEDKKLFLTIMVTLILTTTTMPSSWWARYVPQMWAIPIFISLFSLIENQNKRFVYLLFSIILINSLIINIQSTSWQLKNNKRYLPLMKYAPYPLNETVPIKFIERKIIKPA